MDILIIAAIVVGMVAAWFIFKALVDRFVKPTDNDAVYSQLCRQLGPVDADHATLGARIDSATRTRA